MAIKFDYAVKYHGKYYPAGALIDEPLQEDAEAPESAEKVQAGEEATAEGKPAQKATKPRKKASGEKT